MIILDVREPEEFKASHVASAINIPLSTLMDGTAKLELLQENEPIVLYCRTGNRVNTAIKILRNHGFTKLENGINQENVEKLLRTA